MVEWIVPATDAVVTILLLLIGGNLGSFLNVVVHRLPRGESVVVGGSKCPRCGAAIRWHDNVPVVGWLLLRGRCRDCRAPISPRYPLVEAAGALVLGGVAAVELLSGGATLPGPRWGGGRAGADNLLLRPDPTLIAVAVFHAWLLFVLLAEAAIEADGDQPPRRLRCAALAMTMALVTLVAFLSPVAVLPRAWDAAWEGVPWPWTWLRGLLVTATGAACGRALAWRGSCAFRAGMTLAGAALGWQASLGVFVLSKACAVLRTSLASLVPPPPCDFPAVSPVSEVADAGAGEADAHGVGGGGHPDLSQRAGSGGARSHDLLDDLRRYGSGERGRTADLAVATAIYLMTWRGWARLWP